MSMYGRQEPSSPAPDLQEKVNVLLWIRKTKTILPDLPNGRLKEDLEERIEQLLSAPGFTPMQQLQDQIIQLESEIVSLTDQLKTLEDESLDSCEIGGSSPNPEEEKPERKVPWLTIILIVVAFSLGRSCGADLDLGGTRRTPDASALQSPLGERNTRDVGIPTAPGKSGVPPVDYRYPPTTH